MSFHADVDVDAYCARIGYAGPRAPTLPVLRDVHRLHVGAIPFEAIDVLLGREISLEPAALQAKLVAGGRGGYCFEQNYLFKHALIAFGFEVDALIGRSRWGRPLDVQFARTHMALRVRLDGEEWLADVGMRAISTAPIRLAAYDRQQTPFEPVRLVPVDDELRLEVLAHDGWRPICDLVPKPQLDVDLEAANWFASTHPTSPFRQTLIVSRTVDGVRYALSENRLSIRRPQGEAEHRHLSADQLEFSLRHDFGLAVEPAWRAVLDGAVARGGGLPLEPPPPLLAGQAPPLYR